MQDMLGENVISIMNGIRIDKSETEILLNK